MKAGVLSGRMGAPTKDDCCARAEDKRARAGVVSGSVQPTSQSMRQ
ncbi:MAG: hypothetical protein RR873_00325 [Christensenella sp.]